MHMNGIHQLRIDTLVLLIAYKSSLTLWTIENNGIATELFSVREHNICSACLLVLNSSHDDPHSSHRPLLCLGLNLLDHHPFKFVH